MKTRILTFLTSCAVGYAFITAQAGEKTQAELQAKAKITKEKAQQIALGKVTNGTVKEAELEEEHGRLIWSFDISTPGTKNIAEVGVDAISGEVVENKVEKAKDEEKEKAEEACEKEKK